jgi:hypothetical protein
VWLHQALLAAQGVTTSASLSPLEVALLGLAGTTLLAGATVLAARYKGGDRAHADPADTLISISRNVGELSGRLQYLEDAFRDHLRDPRSGRADPEQRGATGPAGT